MINNNLFKIHKNDNVFVSLESLKKDDIFLSIDNKKATVKESIEKGHKIAAKDINCGDNIIKYGFPIGKASKNIQVGEYIHTHNIKTNLSGLLEYSYEPKLNNVTFPPAKNNFLGYKRNNGTVGIRNEIWIINTVGCINKTSEILANTANKKYTDKIDGVFSFPHPYGCSQMGEDHITTQKILCNLVNHPNAGGVLVLGLGCENNNISEFQKALGSYDENRVKFLSTQDCTDEISKGLELIDELITYSSNFKQEECDISKLIIGLKCGGSDAFSGITANPLVGKFSDIIINNGGTSILTEVPEMFGAETILMNRSKDMSIFNKTVNLINNFKEYYIRHDQVVYDNPSPGNKKGGISTLEEKSLGCIQKGGESNVVDVLTYSNTVKSPGLNLLEGPGNDIVAVTALIAAGAQIVLFTTGRGTPLGGPVPTIKISSNTDLSINKKNWIDFDSGVLLKNRTIDELGLDLYEFVLKVASKEILSKNEQYGYKEIAIFKDGVTL